MCYITGAFSSQRTEWLEAGGSLQTFWGRHIAGGWHGGGANTLHKSRGPVADSLKDQQELESQIDLPPRFLTTKRSLRSLLVVPIGPSPWNFEFLRNKGFWTSHTCQPFGVGFSSNSPISLERDHLGSQGNDFLPLPELLCAHLPSSFYLLQSHAIVSQWETRLHRAVKCFTIVWLASVLLMHWCSDFLSLLS